MIVLTARHRSSEVADELLIDRQMPLLVWTNTQDLPMWQAATSRATLVDPRNQDNKSVILVKSALHLRRNGVLPARPT